MKRLLLLLLFCLPYFGFSQGQPVKFKRETFEPFIWPSEPPRDMPFKKSKTYKAIKFLGIKNGSYCADTWYPTWASNDTLYSPWTDGRVAGQVSESNGLTIVTEKSGPMRARKATTGQAMIVGDDPEHIEIINLGTVQADPYPYGGRYPCGSLVYNGVWYYGTYCLSPHGRTYYKGVRYNWPFIGPLVGFRYSTDYGKTWTETPHNPSYTLLKENGLGGDPVKIGAPHFVDFGKNMEYSPDGKAYLVAHGSDESYGDGNAFCHNSWITGDQIYLIRVTPSIENINDMSKYEFYAGKDRKGRAIWSRNFEEIKPLLEWRGNMGCVTITYNAPLKKYFMCVTDGGNTCSKMNTYILESDKVDGDWRLITYMKDFGEQAYFVNIPSKFIAPDGKTMWLLYSGNYATNWNGEKIGVNPVGSHYGIILQKIELQNK